MKKRSRLGFYIFLTGFVFFSYVSIHLGLSNIVKTAKRDIFIICMVYFEPVLRFVYKCLDDPPFTPLYVQ